MTRADSPAVQKILAEGKNRIHKITTDTHDQQNNTGWAFRVKPCAALASLYVFGIELDVARRLQREAMAEVLDQNDHQAMYLAWSKWQQQVLQADTMQMHSQFALNAGLERVAIKAMQYEMFNDAYAKSLITPNPQQFTQVH